MSRKLFNAFIIAALLSSYIAVLPAGAQPPAPDDVVIPEPDTVIITDGPRVRLPKAIDQPNIKDWLRLRERQRLMEAGLEAEAAALATTGTDRVLVILVEFAGTDVFTWTAGVSTTVGVSHWDPLGEADPNEYTGTVGDCSVIQEKIEATLGYTLTAGQEITFTYTGPSHNEMPRPVSPDDRSADSIWTEDFSKDWFDDFMFGEGVVFSYTMQDSTPVFDDFTGQSVTDFYSDMSGGVYTVTGDVVGWLPVPHSTWYYDADECPGARSGARTRRGAIPGAGTSRTLVQHALDAVNAISDTVLGGTFDWADYDGDGDGVIDRLWIVHAGYGEEDSTTMLNRTDYGEAAVWSHSSSVPPYSVTQSIAAGPYIMMPENGGIGVFAHEYGHNLGADDLYAYGNGETSAGFWTTMADDWTGYPIGFEPPATDPWHLDNWGWLNPNVITDTSKVYTFTLGQASRFPGGSGTYGTDADTYRGAKIMLDDGLLNLAVPVWQGSNYWWGGKIDLSNAMMTTANPITLTGGTTATLSFDLVYDIEDEWDFLWVQVSDDLGTTWNTLTNTNTQCVHDPGWIGELNGFPADLCGAGIGGYYGWNANWPDPEAQTFDLTSFIGESVLLRFWFMTDWGTTYTGVFVDNVDVSVDSTSVFSDNAESGDAKWVYASPWQRSDGTQEFTHNFYLQWRNTNDNGGYDSALGDERWRFGPANTGLLVWYNNNFYTDNEIGNYVSDSPSLGPKGRMLVIDSHPDPYRDPNNAWTDRETSNVTSRALMRDATFSITDTVNFTMTTPYVISTTQYSGRPAVSEFHDSMSYWPGLDNVGGSYPWRTRDWDASAVVPCRVDYGVSPADYPAGAGILFKMLGESGGWYGFLRSYGPGTNPGYVGGQYGWHVKLLEEATDNTWGKVRVWNSMKEFDDTFAADVVTSTQGSDVTFTYSGKNIGSAVDAFVVIPLAEGTSYVPGSAFGGLVPLPGGFTPAQAAAIYAEGGRAALEELASSQADAVGALVWAGQFDTTMSKQFGFDAKITTLSGDITMDASIYDAGVLFQTTKSSVLTVIGEMKVFLPLINR